MGFDFTVAVIPNGTNLTTELQYIKSALLYADKVRLISPLAYTFVQLTSDTNRKNEQSALKLFNQIMPLVKLKDESAYSHTKPIIDQLSKIVFSKQYRSVPLPQRLEIQKLLKNFAIQTKGNICDVLGIEQCQELESLIKSKQVIIEKFASSLGDAEGCISDYFRMLNSSIKNSYPLFDEQSNDLMKSAADEHLIDLSEIEKTRITHAGLADNYIQRLPSFEQASIDEIIDIKKELSNPVVRFRSKMLSYAQKIKSQPWNADFKSECSLLFDKEVAPAILEIEEATKDNCFMKNLGKKFFTDKGAWKTTGGLVFSIAATGVLTTFTNVATAEPMGIIAGGSIATTKIAQAFSEYIQNKKKIERNDLYFYYKAGKLLDK